MVMVESIKKHFELEKQDRESSKTRRKIQHGGPESTEFLREQTYNNTYRNSNIRNMDPTGGSTSTGVVLTVTKEGIGEAGLL